MAMIKKENWKQRVERAKLQLGELIDLDQDPPVRYTAIKCETALLVLEELNKLHISEMKKLLERVEKEVIREIKIIEPPKEVEKFKEKRQAFMAGEMNILMRLHDKFQSLNKLKEEVK